MTQEERREYLIIELLKEMPEYSDIEIPKNEQDKKILLRSLFNIRAPKPASERFISVQNKYLREEIQLKGITKLEDLRPVKDDIYLWQGDITTLACDGIVNAANSQMLGCFCPCHGCIDNAIHTFAGIQLRLKCAEIMNMQGCPEKIGKAKITPGYNLPCKFVLHTVGPIINGSLTKNDCEMLSSCYRSCLELAEQNGLKNIAFCCISTGEFHFPNDKAAQIAINTVEKFKKYSKSKIKVIFNVFKNSDYEIYQKLLRQHTKT